MTKHLRFLFVMLLAMIWSAGWAQTTIDFTKVTWNGGYTQAPFSFKAAKANGTVNPTQPKAKDIRLYAKNTLTVSTTGNKITKIIFSISEKGKDQWADLKSTSGAVVADKAKSIATWENAEGTTSVTFTVGDKCKYGTDQTKVGQFCFNSVDIYELSAGPSKTPTKVAFPAEYSNKTFTFTEGKLEGFTAPTATEANNIAGSIKYSSTNESVVRVNASTGELSFPGYGEATITATFTPTDTEKYEESSDSYMVVNNNPNVKKVTFIDTIDKGKNTTQSGTDEITKEGVTISATKAAFGYDKYYRFYKDSNIKISATVGTIIKIEFTNGVALTNLKGEGYTATSGAATWTGNARTVVLTNSSSVAKAKSITVYVSLPSEITLNETADNTIEAKTGVNVTLNRPMNVGRWNTFCVPFSIDATQVTSQFGEGTQIAEYSVSVDNEIDFATVQSNAIVAGKAYLVKPTKEAATEGYTFSNVNITALAPTKEKVENDAIDFRGIYNPTDITEDLPTNIFAAGIVGNVVKKAVNGSNMKGFRAFFIIPEGVGAQSSYMLKIDGTATSINSINGADVVVNAPVYNLQGQRVDGNNLTPGIYVKAGKKFVVK